LSLKIMVVDDEPLSLQVMRSLAVPLGHNVLTLDASQEASQHVEKQRFDVIFVGMPRPDGLDLVRQIRSSKLNRETTIAMLSPTDDIEVLRQAFGAGVTFVLPKPIVAARVIGVLTAMASPQWKVRGHAARLPLVTEVNCKWSGQDLPMRSVNISESGMLLQSSHDVDEGQEVSLEFRIAEIGASLNLRARVVRKEGAERVGIEFISLAAEDQNAIHLYVMGQLKEKTPQRGLQDIQMHRLFRP
jgi:CheY-like chemotaxis protein